MTDTIAALATAPAPSAIGILRLSGPEAIAVLDRVFTPARGGPMASRPDRTLVYGDLRGADGAVIDRCLATLSRTPHSYTGEDTAELQCHGSPAALALGLEALFAAGARQAMAGEFTRRAFLNGKLDLTRAEAVADLIEAETPAAVRQAANQLGGALAGAIEVVYNDLAEVCAHFHAVLDWPDEDIDPFRAAELGEALEVSARRLDALAATYRRGRAVNEGLPCAIVGRPNAGKSTLFNALLGRERAIVTPVPGTTRDTVEERAALAGMTLRLIDTAGLRDTDDEVERLGVERSRAAMEGAELILVLWDSSRPVTEEDIALLERAMSLAPTILVRSKCDLPSAPVPSLDSSKLPPAVEVSAPTGRGLDQLEQAVAALFPAGADTSAAVLTNARQMEAASRARAAIRRGAEALSAGMPPDAVVADVEEAMSALGELTGRTVREDVTDLIFRRFCVGK